MGRINSALSWIVTLAFVAAHAWQWTVVGKAFGRDARTPIVLIQLLAMTGYLWAQRSEKAWSRRLQTLIFALLFLSTTIVPAIRFAESTLHAWNPQRMMCPMPGDGRMVVCSMFGGEVLYMPLLYRPLLYRPLLYMPLLYMPLLCLGVLIWYLARAPRLPRERTAVRLALAIGLFGSALSAGSMLPWGDWAARLSNSDVMLSTPR